MKRSYRLAVAVLLLASGVVGLLAQRGGPQFRDVIPEGSRVSTKPTRAH
jgi:hypothetical protein